MSNSLRWDNVTPTVQNTGSMQQAQNQMLQGLQGVENLVNDQERRTERIISKEQDENSVAAMEALLSADVSEVANMDLDQFGRMSAQQKQQLMLAKDKRASELLTRAAVDQEHINKAENERVKTATNEFWKIHGDEVEAALRNGDEKGARARIEAALPDDGRLVSSVWDQFNKRQAAFEKHQETIAEHRSRTAIAERTLDNTRQSHRDEDISRNVLDSAHAFGLKNRAETHELQSELIKQGIEMNVLDDKGNVLPGVSAEDLAAYEAMVSERVDGLGSKDLQTLVDEANRIQDPNVREKTIQQIRKNFMAELELTPEQQKGFVAETEALDAAKTSKLQEIENTSNQLRKENWFYDSKFDERTSVEKISAITKIFSGLGDKASDWEFSNRNELMDLVAHGLDIGGGLPPVRITPEIIEAFVAGRGYRDKEGTLRTRWNSAVEARTELSNWLNEPANRQLIVDAETSYGELQDRRAGVEEQYLAETAGINQRIRSTQGFEGGQNLNVLRQQLRGAINNPEIVEDRKIQPEEDPWVKRHITNQLKGDQNPARIAQVSEAALEMAREMGINPSSTETLDTYWENAEKAVMTSRRENAQLANDLHYEFSNLTRQVESLETQINSGLERLQIKGQIAELEAQLTNMEASDPNSFGLRRRVQSLQKQEGERMREWSGAPKSEEAILRLVERRDGMMGEITSLESQLKQLIR